MFCVQNWFTLIAQGLAKVCKMPTQWIMPMGIPVIQPYLKENTEKKFTMNYSIDELMKLKLVCSTLMTDMLILKNDLMVWNLFFVTIQWKSKVILVQQFFICHEMTILILITSTYFYNFDKIPSILFCRVDSKKQRNGFPPNYIHSIDASHMMLTSLEMNRYYFKMSFTSNHFIYE